MLNASGSSGWVKRVANNPKSTLELRETVRQHGSIIVGTGATEHWAIIDGFTTEAGGVEWVTIRDPWSGGSFKIRDTDLLANWGSDWIEKGNRWLP